MNYKDIIHKRLMVNKEDDDGSLNFASIVGEYVSELIFAQCYYCDLFLTIPTFCETIKCPECKGLMEAKTERSIHDVDYHKAPRMYRKEKLITAHCYVCDMRLTVPDFCVVIKCPVCHVLMSIETE